MNKNELRGYLAPEIEVLEMSVEQGFVSSIEDVGERKPDLDW